MPKFAYVILTIAVALLMVGLSLLSPNGPTTTPAIAQASSTSSSASLPSGSSSSSEEPTPPPGDTQNPNGDPANHGELNLAKQAHDNPTTLIACTGTSKEPDLFFRNIGNTTITAGTVVTWVVPSTGEHGTYTLAKDVKPGEALPDTGALAAALGKNGTCLSKLG